MSLKQTLGTYPPRVACSRTRVGVPRRNMKPLRYLIERVQMRQARTLWIDSQRNPRLRVNRLAKRKVGIWLVFMTFFRWASISVFISGSIIHFSRCLNKPNSCFNSFIRRKLCRIVNVLWDFFCRTYSNSRLNKCSKTCCWSYQLYQLYGWLGIECIRLK